MHSYRTHTCGQLRRTDVGADVRLSGWIHSRRDHGGVMFLDLRDHYGITQIVVNPDASFFDDIARLPRETVIRIDGTVAERGDANPNLDTGEIEVVAQEFAVLGTCPVLPLQVHQEDNAAEDIRLKYRFLDLRRQGLHENINLRCDVIAFLRRCMVEHGFREFQTPILTSSSPEGARDYLVPSRVHPGQFYALPQAPQQFKQMLMVAGFDRYFQIAPCFRDEDARADRSPGEFYQLDLEMSFVEQDDVFAVVEDVLHRTFQEFSDKEMDGTPFRRIPFAEAMLKYGTDKPDLRNPLEIRDATDLLAGCGFRVFANIIEGGGSVRALPVSAIADQPRSFFDKLTGFVQDLGAKGLSYIVFKDGEVKGSVAKFLSDSDVQALQERTGAGDGDAIFLVADARTETANMIAGELRTRLGKDLDLLEKDVFRFCWVVDFPMYERDEESGEIVFSHNPFSMPQGGMDALENQDPLTILAYQYDIVCNGVELSSGAIRNHRPEIMYKAFAIAGYGKDEVDSRFGGMINALTYGAPPHGGIAPGVDRIVMLLAEEPNIRQVIAFPMNQKAQDLLMGAPAEATARQLEELHIRIVLPEPEDD